MWKTVANVSSGLTLLAFITAAAVLVYRRRLLQTERLIRSTPENQRAHLVGRVFDAVNVDTRGLTREQRYQLALKLIHSRSRRFMISALIIVITAFLAAGLAAYAINRQRDIPRDENKNAPIGDPPSAPGDHRVKPDHDITQLPPVGPHATGGGSPATGTEAIYHIRITVLDPEGIPIEDAKVSSSAPGEMKQTAGGWELDIPAASKPSNGKVTLYAKKESSFLYGASDLQLKGDLNPTARVQLKKDASALVRGIIVDDSDKPVTAARVSVVGHAAESTTTKQDGEFVLPAHAAKDQQVQLRVDTAYKSVTKWCFAGDHHNKIRLEKE